MITTEGSPLPFSPKPELQLLPFPAVTGTRFNAAGSDGVTSIQYEGVVAATERVDACGENVDGTTVKLENGHAVSQRAEEGADLAEVFNATYVIATQYGGVLLRSEFHGASPDAAGPTRDLFSVISRAPVEPLP
jgi:hypothetical protein